MEVPRLGVKSEPQQPATATAMPHPSHVHDLHHSSQGNTGSLTHRSRPGIEPGLDQWVKDMALL